MELAERSDRLKAALIDGLIFVVLSFLSRIPIVGWAFGLGLIAVLAYQWYLLATLGQTIGKTRYHLRVVRSDTRENGGFVTNVLLRSIVNGFLTLVPLYFIIDSLLIFREDRRCIHDFLAGTVVVNA